MISNNESNMGNNKDTDKAVSSSVDTENTWSDSDHDKVEQSYREILAWPKIELHAHLNGCIREETVFELAKERSVTLSAKHFAPPSTTTHHSNNTNNNNKNHNKKQVFMYNETPRSLEDCFEMFADIPKFVNDLPALRRITWEALQDFGTHHVAYLELRTTPKRMLQDSRISSQQQQVDKRTYLETVLKVMQEFEQEEEARYQRDCQEQEQHPSDHENKITIRLPLVCSLIVAVDRAKSMSEAKENVQLAIHFAQQPDARVVGVDLGGNPTCGDFETLEPLFREARQHGLRVTLHCAEVPCAENDDNDDESSLSPALQRARAEVQAMLRFRPDRLGHALLLPRDLQEELNILRIPVETCPTSNVMTLELAHRKDGNLIHALQQDHPALATWIASDYPLAIGTDDPGVFSTNCTQELVLLQHAFSLESPRLQKLVLQSLDYAFCDEATQQVIRERWIQRYP